MRKNLCTPLLLALTSAVTVQANAATSWIETAHEYAEIPNKPYRWGDDRAAADLTLNDVLRALPAPDEWSELRENYAASLPADGTSEAEAALTRCLLAYLDGDTEATDAHLGTLESALQGNEQATADLRRHFYDANKTAAPEKVIEQFEAELKRHRPASQENLIDILGSAEALAQIEAYLDAQQAIVQEYAKLFSEGMPEGGEAEMFALQERATKLASEHAEATETLEAHAGNPTLQKYLSTRLSPDGFGYVPSIQVPDLVTLAGEERARELLSEALRSNVQLSINNADATLRMARELALELIDTLAAPQWRLTHSIDQVELYEAMAAKFPSNSGDPSYELRRATGYYFWGLVAAGRTDEAMAMIDTHPELIDNMPYDAVRNLKKAGHGLAVWQFLDQLLLAHPNLELWDDYMSLSAELERSEQMLKTVQAAISAEGADARSTIEKQIILASAFLSANDIDAAVERLKQALAVPAEDSETAEAQLDAAIKLARLGHLLDESEWVETGLAGARLESIEFVSEYGGVNAYRYLNLVSAHQAVGQNDEAEALLDTLIERIEREGKALVAKNKETKDDSDPYAYRSNDFNSMDAFRADNRSAYQNALVAKLGIRVAQEDYDAAQSLLDENELWLAEDAAALLTETDQSPERRPFGWLVAQTLHAQGASAKAAKVLEALLREQNGYDPAYALYLEIQGGEAVAYFDKLYAIDQFQERPLIWKAQHLVNQGEIEAAEAVATHAISIDPSDGEQPKNDRMRVYDVMRQIRAAQGKDDEAAFFADVLQAIRLSENADDYYSLGLHTQAIERYLKSLEFFQDAYCIQSRVAVRLYDEGRVDEAVAHYRKAYELMPSSFGRVESHCFGCESVFKGDKPQSIAEEVFSGLLVTQPEVPQVHYLMGYLRDYQDREVDALKHLRDAVELDPDYLNAWKKIYSLSRQMSFSQDEKDELILKIYSLDPLGQHSSPSLHEIENIKAMWRAVTDNQELLKLVPKPTKVYPLAAAAEFARSLPEDNNRYGYNDEIEHPADALERNEVIDTIEDLFVELSQSPMN